MPVSDNGKLSISGKALASLLLGAVSVPAALLNSRDAPEGGDWVALAAAALGLALAALAVKDVWQRRVFNSALLFALPGAGLSLLGIDVALGARAYQDATARRAMAASNIRKVVLSLLDYAGATGALPPAAVCGKDGKPLLSWRVLVLPFLEREGEAEQGLFRQFHLDEPWDGPHNLPLLARMPAAYAPPKGITTAEPHATFCQAFVGPGAAFEGAKGVRLADFPDGKGNTLLVVEGGEAVPWTKPEDLPYVPGGPLPPVGGVFRSGTFAAFADGSVEFLPRELDEKTLRALVTRNGGDKPGPGGRRGDR